MARSIKEIRDKANRDILQRHFAGVYRPVIGPDTPREFFAIASATEWVGDEAAVSLTDYLINMTDRSWVQGDQVVTETEGTYVVHSIVELDAGMLTLRATKTI